MLEIVSSEEKRRNKRSRAASVSCTFACYVGSTKATMNNVSLPLLLLSISDRLLISDTLLSRRQKVRLIQRCLFHCSASDFSFATRSLKISQMWPFLVHNNNRPASVIVCLSLTSLYSLETLSMSCMLIVVSFESVGKARYSFRRFWRLRPPEPSVDSIISMYSSKRPLTLLSFSLSPDITVELRQI